MRKRRGYARAGGRRSRGGEQRGELGVDVAFGLEMTDLVIESLDMPVELKGQSKS